MKILITGGAGFIGSNLAEALLNDERISLVRVLDNLETGHLSNLDSFIANPKFEFIKGDIRNQDDCTAACRGIDAISHQAALGSVPRSIEDPMTTHDVNVNGFVNILEAARKNNIKRIVYASSSSIYGDLKDSPKVETKVGKVLSPYAAGKMTNELYAEAYAKNYNMKLIGLRYFNVFGPKQDPEGPYAAVIPLFIKAALKNQRPLINGDGTITRDFTPIKNVVQINISALKMPLNKVNHEVVNVACGKATTLNELWQMIKIISSSTSNPISGPNRKGDILFSLADINKAMRLLEYNAETNIYEGLKETVNWFLEQRVEK